MGIATSERRGHCTENPTPCEMARSPAVEIQAAATPITYNPIRRRAQEGLEGLSAGYPLPVAFRAV